MPYKKNADDCCVYVPHQESDVIEKSYECDTGCCVPEPTNPCGLTHPTGSGTIAGCKSTTLPHFGVTLGKRDDTCHRFAYYTSGNTEEYENVCGTMDTLEHTEVVETCLTRVEYETTPCDPCNTGGTVGNISDIEADIAALEERMTANEAVDTTQTADIGTNTTAIAANTAKNTEQDTAIAANVDNTVQSLRVENGDLIAVYEDGSEVNVGKTTDPAVTQAIADNVDNTVTEVTHNADGEEQYVLEDGTVVATGHGVISVAEAQALIATL